MIQVLIDFIVAVAAQITACYLCSDSHEEVGWNIPLYPRTKKSPLRVAAPRGFFLCLLALAVTLKPLAQEVCSYLCCDSHQKIG